LLDTARFLVDQVIESSADNVLVNNASSFTLRPWPM
jgi:hypothetical protein